VHSEDQRARVEGPSEGRVPIRMRRCPVPASGSYAYGGVRRRRSPPRLPSDIRCHRRARYPRRKPLVPITSRPRPPFRAAHREACRLPEDRDAFRRHDTRGNCCRGEIAPSGPHAGSLAHATHTFSTSLWKVLCRVLQVSRCGHPRSVTVPARSWVESTDTFFTHSSMPGTDDPSMPVGSTDSAVDGS